MGNNRCWNQLLGGLINYNYPLCCKHHHLTLRSSKTFPVPSQTPPERFQHPPPPAEWNECKQREEETEDSWIICLSALGWNMTIKAILARVGPGSYSGWWPRYLQPGQCLRLRSDSCNCFVYPKISATSSGAARLDVVTILVLSTSDPAWHLCTIKHFISPGLQSALISSSWAAQIPPHVSISCR